MVGKIISKIRNERGLTQYRLAKMIGTPQSDMARIETGRTKNPTWQRMIRIADALDVSLDELAGRSSA